jgi:tungstate transport system substrate-binding protein
LSQSVKFVVFFLTHLSVALTSHSQAKSAEYITLASTTSTRDTGLLSSILPIFTKGSGIRVRVVAVGTGQAINIAKNGDADVLLVHDKKSEQSFVANGYGVKRFKVMHNDFVVVGPAKDPAAIAGMKDVVKAFGKIAHNKSIFLSRGDDSGTNKKEYGLWHAGGIDTTKASGDWYRETGSGMGATLNMASAMNGYSLADRGTWLAFKNRKKLKILVEGDTRLLNPYGVILVNPKRHPHVKAAAGKKLIDWLISKEGQSAISAFKINGEQLFKGSLKQKKLTLTR